MDPETLTKLTSARLIKAWRMYASMLDTWLAWDVPTMGVARSLGMVEREMERRGIRHDDYQGEVLDDLGVWHTP